MAPVAQTPFNAQPRTLKKNMKLAEYYKPAKAQRVAHLGVKGMLALMRKTRRSAKRVVLLSKQAFNARLQRSSRP